MSTEKKTFRPAKSHKPALPPFTGEIKCPRGHTRMVVDLNVEKVTTICPVNGCYTDIKEGIKAAI